MKKFLFVLCFSPLVMFSQSGDISKKEAYELFLKSPTRDSLELKSKDFEKVYKNAKCIKNNYKIKLKEMPIFNPKIKAISYKEEYNYIEVAYGFPEEFTTLPERDDFGRKTNYCGVLRYR